MTLNFLSRHNRAKRRESSNSLQQYQTYLQESQQRLQHISSSLVAPYSPKKTLACVTMVFNEADWLPVWLSYYSSQVLPSHCYVIDHGSTDNSTNDLGGAHRVWLPRSPLDEVARASFVSSFCSSLLNYYDFVLYTDVDEIVVPDPANYKGLLDYVQNMIPNSVITCLGMEIIHKIDEETKLDLNVPILAQRSYCQFVGAACKPLLIGRSVQWTPGFHDYNGEIKFNDIFLFHLPWCDHHMAIKRGEKRRNTPPVDPNMNMHHKFSVEQIQALILGLSQLEVVYDVSLDANCRFMASCTERAIEAKSKGLFFDFRGNNLCRIPERFKTVF